MIHQNSILNFESKFNMITFSFLPNLAFALCCIVYETAFAKEAFMTKKIEVEDATNGG